MTNDLQHRAQEGEKHSSDWCWAVHQTSRQRVRAGRTSGRSREPSSAEPDERCRVQTFEAEAQRRGVPGNAQEWSRTRHGGVHDHTEKWNDEPEQPSYGRNSLYTRRARRGETRWGWGFQTTRSTRVSVRRRTRGSARGQARVSSRQATHCEVGVSSALAERD